MNAAQLAILRKFTECAPSGGKCRLYAKRNGRDVLVMFGLTAEDAEKWARHYEEPRIEYR